MDQAGVAQTLHHCDQAIERLRQAQHCPDAALALLDARTLLLATVPTEPWDAALTALVQEGA